MLCKIKQKLKNRQGVSFLFALIAFLVATMVAATIVSAAITSIKRVNSDREAQQNQMILSSAAELVRDEMLNTKVVCLETKEGSEEAGYTITKSYSGSGTFLEEMKAGILQVEDLKTKYTSQTLGGNFTISVGGSGFPPVSVSYVMQDENEDLYKVVFTFTMSGSSETLFLSLQGTASRSGDETTYTWNTPYINGLGE